MNFARRQLEKYGWSDGKGLGKHENGISEALKPKLKRSVTGIGHDAAAEFNEHWWSALYDKAAKNVEVEEKKGKTKKIKTVDSEDFTITNSTWRINKKRKTGSENNEYSEYFVRKAVLTNEGTRIENVTDSETDEDDGKKDVFKMTDEQLFAACEGRTAHKGARHGLKALGKLARIAQQEQVLLTQSKYEGYSHAKKIKHGFEEVVDDTSLVDSQEANPRNKKKKKRKRCISNENSNTNIICGKAVSEVHHEAVVEDISVADNQEETPRNKRKKKRKHCITNDNSDAIIICEKAESEVHLSDSALDLKSNKVAIEINEDGCGRKSKKSNKQAFDDELNPDSSNNSFKKSKRNKKLKLEQIEVNKIVQESSDVPKKKKKQKNLHNVEEE